MLEADALHREENEQDPGAIHRLFVLILYVGVSSDEEGEHPHSDHEDFLKRA